MFRNAVCLLSLCVLPNALATSSKAQESAPSDKAQDTLVSPSESSALFSAMDSLFTREQVCEDYELGLHLLALVQSPQGHRGNNTTGPLISVDLKNCPGTLSGVAKELKKRVTALKDFHTNFDIQPSKDKDGQSTKPGIEKMNGTVLPIVTACSDPGLCSGLIGAPLYPLRTEATLRTHGQALYTFAKSAEDSEVHFYNIESINGKDTPTLINDLRNSQDISKTRAGTSVEVVNFLLSRHVLDSLDRNDKEFALRDIQTGARFNVTTSYVPNPDRNLLVPSVLNRKYQLGFRSSKAFGCVEIEPGSSESIGGCLTDKDRLVVWISTFSPGIEDGDIVQLTQSLLASHPQAAKLPVILDVRNNTGGNPYLAAKFACTFGDDRTVKEMKKRRYAVSFWPEYFSLSSGKIFSSRDLVKSENEDLFKIFQGWTVSSLKADTIRRDYTVGFFEREKQAGHEEWSDSKCVQQRDLRFTNTKWVVMMNGREFSTTENFLSFIAPSLSKFKLIGADTTSGGTGTPMTITLPNTNMRLRLSLARHINGIDGSFPIEGVGVPSTLKILRDDFLNFEKRLLDDSNGIDITTSDYSPDIFRYSQTIRP